MEKTDYSNVEINPDYLEGLSDFRKKLMVKDKSVMFMINNYYKEAIPLINRMGTYNGCFNDVMLKLDEINKTMDESLYQNLFELFYGLSPEQVWINKELKSN